jgi:UDP-GlcNAc:undecaprenyl-phosphate GlcNAc-1-phosphate transferase
MVHFVGAGPGAADLITVRGRKYLEEADLVIYAGSHEKILPVIIGGSLIYLLGIMDDLLNLPAKFKFLAQTGVAILMYSMGLRITLITDYFGDGGVLQFGTVVCFIVTILWIVGITNTINLIDGLDGLAAGLAAIAGLSIAYVAYIHGDKYGMMVVCLAMLALAGSCAGFLPFNFHPAKTFMGDGGSLFLGFMIAVLSVVGPLKKTTVLAVVVPVIVLGIPIFDTAFAILRRVINHKPIMSADRGHLHHRLVDAGFSQKQAVSIIYILCLILCIAAVILIATGAISWWVFISVILGFILFLWLTPRIIEFLSDKEEHKHN